MSKLMVSGATEASDGVRINYVIDNEDVQISTSKIMSVEDASDPKKREAILKDAAQEVFDNTETPKPFLLEAHEIAIEKMTKKSKKILEEPNAG